MPSKLELINKLEDLSSTENGLWKAFRKAENDSQIGIFNFKKQLTTFKKLQKSNSSFKNFYPLFQIIAIVSAITLLFLKEELYFLTFSVYIIALIATAYTREKFLIAFSKIELSDMKITGNSFGLDFISLKIFKILENYTKAKNNKLTENKLDSIIKIIKSSQDYESYGFGYNEYLQKFFIALIFSSPILIYNNLENIKIYSEKITTIVANGQYYSISFLIIFILILIAFIILIYSYAYGDRANGKRKKRYLLMLTILKESYVSN